MGPTTPGSVVETDFRDERSPSFRSSGAFAELGAARTAEAEHHGPGERQRGELP